MWVCGICVPGTHSSHSCPPLLSLSLFLLPLQVLQTIKKDKTAKRHESNVNRKAQKDKLRDKETERFADVHKEKRKREHMQAGKDEMRKKQKAERGR